ncbi:MAG: leukotoxin LktA family filamentous adhesin [Candidatus Melainabacteria bacterium]|nr:MAG: leukotoxin LktA family filamentous adhesin [Candidatus Melainabacteria bacterium]
MQQACVLPVLASTITGITNGGSGTFNINPQVTNSGTGFRHYNRFELSQGDIANLIYSGGISRFVNLVDNNILINGILNTMRDGNFYNGTAVFVSPRGLTVGASGVLNVGSFDCNNSKLARLCKIYSYING